MKSLPEWIIHYVFDEKFAVPSMNEFELINIHTHGVLEKYNHPDLQVVLPLNQQLAHYVMWELVNLIKSGKTFKAGDISEEVISNYSVYFINAYENDRNVIRMIMPDKNGTLNDPRYAAQVLDCLNINEANIIETALSLNYNL